MSMIQYHPRVILIGPMGTGKTRALTTLLDAGLEVCAIFTEPDMEVVSDTDPNKFHWKYISPGAPNWDDLYDMADKINTLSYEALCKVQDPKRGGYTQFLNIIKACSNYVCDRTGKSFGPVDKLDPGKFAFVIDSLSGLSTMAMALQVGGRPVRGKQDYGVAMDHLYKFILKFSTSIPCTTVLTSHPEKETNEITGGITLTLSTLGQKLAPQIGKTFSDVIACRREGKKFFWSNMEVGYELKKRNLEFGDAHPPSFVPLIENWRARAKAGNDLRSAAESVTPQP